MFSTTQGQEAMACEGGTSRAVSLPPAAPLISIRGLGLGLPGVRPDSREIAASPALAARAVARGFRRHLRLRLCGDLGCSGGRFFGR